MGGRRRHSRGQCPHRDEHGQVSHGRTSGGRHRAGNGAEWRRAMRCSRMARRHGRGRRLAPHARAAGEWHRAGCWPTLRKTMRRAALARDGRPLLRRLAFGRSPGGRLSIGRGEQPHDGSAPLKAGATSPPLRPDISTPPASGATDGSLRPETWQPERATSISGKTWRRWPQAATTPSGSRRSAESWQPETTATGSAKSAIGAHCRRGGGFHAHPWPAGRRHSRQRREQRRQPVRRRRLVGNPASQA